jgi:hypothetical protein
MYRKFDVTENLLFRQLFFLKEVNTSHEFITGKYVVLTGGKTLQFASGSSSTTRTRIWPSSDYMMSREVKKKSGQEELW